MTNCLGGGLESDVLELPFQSRGDALVLTSIASASRCRLAHRTVE